MNGIIKCSIFFIIFLIAGCGPNYEELLDQAESTVQSFVDELNMQNFNSAEEIYPDIKEISRYNIPKNFKISSSKFTSDDKNEVKVMGDYGIGENTKPLQFVLAKKDSESWLITRSKGLSSYYETSLYNTLKISGCLKDFETDVSIHQTCQNLEPKFESLVNDYKKNIENSILLEQNGSYLTNNYNIDISGELMLKNNSNITVPGSSYETYIIFYDRKGKPSHSSKYLFNRDPLLANDYHQISIFSMDYHSDYRKYSATVKITNDQFIRRYLAQKGNFNCSEQLNY